MAQKLKSFLKKVGQEYDKAYEPNLYTKIVESDLSDEGKTTAKRLFGVGSGNKKVHVLFGADYGETWGPGG
jgi:hypothetical protein